jgi:glycosyltransferase involved in cell wall biosynthesis
LADLIFTIRVFVGLLALNPKPSVVLVVTNPFVLVSAAHVYRIMSRVPYVYVLHDLYPDILVPLRVLRQSSPALRVLRLAQKVWLHAAARVVALGRCMRDHVSQEYGIPAERVEVVTNWSDLNRIVPQPRTTHFRAMHGIRGFLALYSGNIGLFHDVETVLDAALLLGERAPGVTIGFVGRGGGKEQLRMRIHQECITNVRLFDYVPEADLPDLLASADVHLVTLASGTRGLAVPLKFYNALASGRPVVAVMDENEITSVLDEHECGMHVRPGQGARLADAVAELAASPERVSLMGTRARHLAATDYSISFAARRYQKLLGEVARCDGQRC